MTACQSDDGAVWHWADPAAHSDHASVTTYAIPDVEGYRSMELEVGVVCLAGGGGGSGEVIPDTLNESLIATPFLDPKDMYHVTRIVNHTVGFCAVQWSHLR
jgi:hypothetical protein